MRDFSTYVRGAQSGRHLRSLLEGPVDTLLGVGPGAAAALGPIGVATIFDLGTSSVFAQAAAIVSATPGQVSGDLLDPSIDTSQLSELGELPVASLRSLDAATAADLEAELAVSNVRDFAFWPARQIAHQMVSAAAGADLDDIEDEVAESLRPQLGEYPTERVYYDRLVMFGSAAGPNATPLQGPLELDGLLGAAPAFGAPAVGAIATYAQSWYVQGITLGQMVHSLALAPGEATRIAVIDWSRRTRASATEQIDESEQLDNSLDHSRSISEVQNAVASEMQRGGSMTSGWAKSTSDAWGVAGSIGGGVAGVIGNATAVLGIGGGGSKSSQEAETESSASSVSWSRGTRDVMSNMSQFVNDRTEQHATSVRNRRATAVREVSQAEHEQVSTRVVANYNHMHALTVQYYEVVQLYRVQSALHRIERAVFVPFQLLDFSAANGAALIDRFRGQLLASALNERAAGLLLDERGKIVLRGGVRVELPIRVDATLPTVATPGLVATAGPGVGSSTGGSASSPSPTTDPKGPLRFSSVRAGPVADVVDGDADLVAISFQDLTAARIRLDRDGVPASDSTVVVPPATQRVDLATPVPLREIRTLLVAHDGTTARVGSMVLHLERAGQAIVVEVPLSLTDSASMQKAVFIDADAADRHGELVAHLDANRAHYTAGVLGRLDPGSLGSLLANVTWNGVPLIDQVDPRPVAVAGNYLVLKAPVERTEASGLDGSQWGDLLDERGVNVDAEQASADIRLVPIPTGGVFAEAVLGRSNSAEKLDITRFWNWQDSPIPLQPPEIAPVSTNSRATPEDLSPGQLGAPVVNVMAPTNLPDPAGLSAVLGAVANGSMFRDMSGLAGTQSLAQNASGGTLQAATEAGRIASENYKTATEQATEMGKAAADMWKTMQSSGSDGSGGGGSGGPKSAGITGDGARINHGRDLDERSGYGTMSGLSPGATPTLQQRLAERFPGVQNASYMPGPGIWREGAYTDQAVAMSPDLIAQTTQALGGTPPGPAQTILDDLKRQAERLGLAVRDGVILDLIRQDAIDAGLPYGNVRLLPMRLHDNAADFRSVPWVAWTQSAQTVYVDVQALIAAVEDALPDDDDGDIDAWMQALEEAMMTTRAFALIVLRHESGHVTQFANNGGAHPATFEQMIDFEHVAYGEDAVWIEANRERLKGFGLTDTDVDDYKAGMADTAVVFAGFKTLTSEAARKQQMVNNKHTSGPNAGDPNPFLPAAVRGRSGYGVGDLYTTKSP